MECDGGARFGKATFKGEAGFGKATFNGNGRGPTWLATTSTPRRDSDESLGQPNCQCVMGRAHWPDSGASAAA